MKFYLKYIYFGLFTALLISVSGCSEEERKIVDYAYLDYEAIEFLEDSNEKGVYKKYYDIEIKKDFVRWTATIEKIKNGEPITLREQGLPEIELNFEDDIASEYDFKKGDIVTVSCNSEGYNYVFWDVPRWWLENCKIEETTEEEKSDLLAYQNAVKEKKAENKNEAEIKQKEEEQKKEASLANAKQVEEKEKVQQAKDKETQLIEQKEAIKVYLIHLFELEETVNQSYEDILAAAESSSFFDVYEKAKTAKEVADEAGFHGMSTANFPDDLTKDIEVLVKEINQNYRDSFYSTEQSAKYAMDYAETQKPSDFSKMKEERERASGFILVASASIIDLMSKVGLSIEEIKP